jgi:predicted ATPase
VPVEHTVDVRVAFVGRREELRQLIGAVEGGKTITLVGTGGVGKSRLALEAIERWERDSERRAAFVALAQVPPESVADAIGRALEISEEPNRSVIDTIADELAGAPRTIVLDNCEHAAAEVASVVERLRKIPGVAIVATSRSRLGLSDELVLPVTPFDARDGSAFFTARARSGTVRVDIDGADAPAVDRIVANLDGLAIAIDLAAARLASLNVAELADELSQLRPYHFRSSGSREQRHWSLNHVVDWSVERLSEDGRRAFALLGRLGGTFDADDLAALHGDEAGGFEDAEAILESLFAQSLIVRAGSSGAYSMLTPLRAVSIRRLARLADRRAVDARFAARMNALAGEIERRQSAPGSASKLAEVASRYQDFTTALAWALQTPRERLQSVTDVFHALTAIWCDGGRFADGLRWCDRVLTSAGVLDLPTRSRVLYGAILVAHTAGDYRRMLTLGPQLITAFTIASDSLGLARAYNALGIASLFAQRIDAAETYCRTALALYEALGHNRGVATALINLGNVAHEGRCDPAMAQQLFNRALELLEKDGSDALMAIVRGNLADAALDLQNPAEAESQARLGIERLTGTGNAAHAAWQRTTIARAKLARGDAATAARELGLAFALLREQHHAQYAAGAVHATVRVLAERGDEALAASLLFALRRFRAERSVPARGLAEREETAQIDRLHALLGETGMLEAAERAKSIEVRELLEVAERALNRGDRA